MTDAKFQENLKMAAVSTLWYQARKARLFIMELIETEENDRLKDLTRAIKNFEEVYNWRSENDSTKV